MQLQNNRNAFSTIIALIVIVLMSTVAMLVVSLSGKITKETTAQFQREQAILLAKSYTEYAVMAVMSNDRTTHCLENITSSNSVAGSYKIETRIAYIGNSSTVDNCSGTRILSDTVTTTKSPLNIIVDVYVRYQDFDHHDPDNPLWISYHRRTLQKI